MSAILTAWLLTIALHGSAFLALAWICDRALQRWRGARTDALRESLWRAALCGGVLTATLQIAAGVPSFGGRWQFETEPLSAPVPTTAANATPAAPSTDVSGFAPATSTRNVVPGHSAASTTAKSQPGSTMPSARFGAALRSAAWSTWIVCAWLAGVLIAIVRILRNIFALRRALAAAVALEDCVVGVDAAALAQHSGTIAPRLLTLAGLASPLATSRSRIVLPDWALVTLDRAQLRAMLAHEIAHLARRDPQWKLFSAIWLALFWFVPLSRIAQRRLDELAELACDAYAARAVGDGRGLAECLAACAERRFIGPGFAIAAAMAVRESSFVQRIERLLEGIPQMETQSRHQISALRVLTVCALAAGTVVLPGIGLAPPNAYAAQATPAAPRRRAETDSHISIHSGDGSDNTTISFSDGNYKFQAAIDGKVSFNADESDVASLSSGGKATFAETRAGETHRVEITQDAGQLVRRYFVNDVERPWDDGARTWLAKLVVDVERSGVGAEAREQRLFAAGGAGRVLDEIEQIPNDYARSLYLKLLLAHGKLAPGDVDRAVRIAGTAQSDYERRQQMQAIFETQVLGAAQQIAFLEQAQRFDSDYERAEFLVGLAPTLVDSAEVRQAWLDAALGVHSDYERRRTLTAMLDRPALDDAQLEAVIKASSTMGSDYERRELLVATIRRARDTEKLAPAYASAVQGIGSAYERREALLALIRSGKVGVHGADAVLDAAAGIDSSYERREVLVELARVMPRETAQIAHYRKLSESLDGYDRREAEQALQL